MATLEKTRLPETGQAAPKPLSTPGKEVTVASALAGRPIHLPRTSSFDVILETHIYDPSSVMGFLTGYRKPAEIDVIKAIRNGPGTKIGTVLGGGQALKLLLAARESGGEVTFRISTSQIKLGDEFEPDLRLASITMMGCERFTSDHGWLVCEIAGYDRSPDQLAAHINENAWKIVNVIEQVPLPVAAATHDLLNSKGFSNVSVRQAVPRTN